MSGPQAIYKLTYFCVSLRFCFVLYLCFKLTIQKVVKVVINFLVGMMCVCYLCHSSTSAMGEASDTTGEVL